MHKFFQRAVAAFETRLAARRSDFVKFLGGIIKELEQRVAFLEGELERQSARHAELSARQSEAIDAAVYERERQLDELRQRHADAIVAIERERAVERHESEEKLATARYEHQDAMASADEVIDELRSKYAALSNELAGVKQNLELKNKALEVAEEQNETLWEVIERDRARVQAERHAYQRAAAEAANAARTVGIEEIEGE